MSNGYTLQKIWIRPRASVYGAVKLGNACEKIKWRVSCFPPFGATKIENRLYTRRVQQFVSVAKNAHRLLEITGADGRKNERNSIARLDAIHQELLCSRAPCRSTIKAFA